MSKADIDVSKNIIDKFKEEKILSMESIDTLFSKLPLGEMTPDDWRLLFDIDSKKEEDQ